jgi:hypothetical protein
MDNRTEDLKETYQQTGPIVTVRLRRSGNDPRYLSELYP